MKKYPIVTLCGSTRFKEDFLKVQKELTLKKYIVISVGLFGHSGDEEVWERLDEDTLTETKLMLDDMHKEKIDMADEIFVINPQGYIGDSTWSEICYAYMTDKRIESLEPIDIQLIEKKVHLHKMIAEQLAKRQFDVYSHTAADYPGDYVLNSMVTIKKGKNITVDPWIPEDDTIFVCDYSYIGHTDKNSGYDPFKVYGKKKMARFIENIIIKNRVEAEKKSSRKEMMDEIKWYCNQLDLEFPKECPEEMTDEEMRDWIACWSEYDPLPELK